MPPDFWRRLTGTRTREPSRALTLTAPDRESIDLASYLPARLRKLDTLPERAAPLDAQTRVEVARGMNRGAGVLAGSVLFDSAIEHYRGGFHNPAMFFPLVSSTLSIIASASGVGDNTPSVRRERHVAYAAAAATGFAGLAFHAYNVGKRTGGFSWTNVFYGAPLGAPAALVLSGLLGVAAERVRDAAPGQRPRLYGMPESRAIAAVTSAGLAGTAAEAALLHFRGAFQDPFMYLPVTIPPVTAAMMAAVAVDGRPRKRPVTRFLLRLTAFLGFAGTGFHIIGVHRNMGGWKNWTQNIQNGPPIPAPPSFTGLALAG
ncbi:MAG: hypothetical protein J0H57_11015, partial [Rhodospirillales bacterium]|nr:hypothetical protein [Rhodospirillales bacterium]